MSKHVILEECNNGELKYFKEFDEVNGNPIFVNSRDEAKIYFGSDEELELYSEHYTSLRVKGFNVKVVEIVKGLPK
jgi:hypothetical protein